MNLTVTQRETIDAIVSIFETGALPSPAAYATATVLTDGAGLSYGIHQATARSGALLAIVREFYALGGRLGTWTVGEAGSAVLQSIGARPDRLTPNVATALVLLREAGADSRMRQAQDAVFERLYWAPALVYATGLRLELPLSMLAVYDLAVHSGHGRIDVLRQTFPELPPSRGGAEEAWTAALVEARHRWLSTHGSELVRRTAYRTQALRVLVARDQWPLERPLIVWGMRIE